MAVRSTAMLVVLALDLLAMVLLAAGAALLMLAFHGNVSVMKNTGTETTGGLQTTTGGKMIYA